MNEWLLRPPLVSGVARTSIPNKGVTPIRLVARVTPIVGGGHISYLIVEVVARATLLLRMVARATILLGDGGGRNTAP
jgi:hypothetical protein